MMSAAYFSSEKPNMTLPFHMHSQRSALLLFLCFVAPVIASRWQHCTFDFAALAAAMLGGLTFSLQQISMHHVQREISVRYIA